MTKLVHVISVFFSRVGHGDCSGGKPEIGSFDFNFPNGGKSCFCSHRGVCVCVCEAGWNRLDCLAGKSGPVEVWIANMNNVPTSVLDEPVGNEPDASKLIRCLLNPARCLETLGLSWLVLACFHSFWS